MSISVNGVRIGVIERGKKSPSQPVLVLLHGFTGSASSWGHLLDDLVSPDLSVIALDMLGHGNSDAPEDPARYSIEHCQEDILTVLARLGIATGQAILLGYSLGGRIALYSAFSGYFRALILESASPGLVSEDERAQRRASDDALAARIERDGVEAFVHEWEHLSLFASQQALPPQKWQALHTQRLNNHVSGLANSLRGVGTGVQPSLHARLSELTLPTLLITGALDLKFCHIAREMARHIPRTEWHSVQGAGHAVHLEQPEQFCALVRKFCAAVL